MIEVPMVSARGRLTWRARGKPGAVAAVLGVGGLPLLAFTRGAAGGRPKLARSQALGLGEGCRAPGNLPYARDFVKLRRTGMAQGGFATGEGGRGGWSSCCEARQGGNAALREAAD